MLASMLFALAQLPLLWADQRPFTAPADGKLVSDATVEYIEALRGRWGVAGLSIAVVATPESKWGGGEWRNDTLPFGTANAAGDPVTRDTLFALASNSKLYTALSIGMLINNETALPGGGKLSWDTKVADILPEWKLPDDYASKHLDMTDLLSMHSGMPRHDMSYGGYPPEKMVKNMRNLRASAEIRQTFQYNNMHYATAALIVGRLSGLEYTQFVRKHILEPVGMTDTTYSCEEAARSGKRSDGWLKRGVNETRCRETFTGVDSLDASCTGRAVSFGWWSTGECTWTAGMGGIISSAVDQAKWLRELLAPRVIPDGLIARVINGHTVQNGGPSDPEMSPYVYGFGQHGSTYRGHYVVGHTGGLPGMTSIVVRLPYDGLGVVVMVNDATALPRMFEIPLLRILDDLLGLEPIDWETRFTNQSLSRLPEPVQLPENPTPPPVSFKHIAGKYSDKGYGTLKLRLAKVGELDDPVYDGLRATPGLNLTGPVFITDLDKAFANRAVLTHFDGALFNLTALNRVQTAEGELSEMSGAAEAVITKHGIGLFGNVWGAYGVPVRHAAVKDAQKKAEVWFEKH